ncbi:hypothetical protein H9P43_008889 [Blastocladiella emersonii ATCC 22665]|nr:hypothetical protein H9P43_008889 [Blastocladiella emersonii ATCC 22665]
MVANLFVRKSVEDIQADAAKTGLRRSLTGLDLMLLGIGEIIGAGIFVITGRAARNFAGPGIILSFVISGIACAFAGLCYSELSSIVPSSGSAYMYAYAAVGEVFAFLVGWDLMLEYLVGAATVAVGWSAYLLSLLAVITGTEKFSTTWTAAPWQIDEDTGAVISGAGCATCGVVNLPAIAISIFCTIILSIGIRQSAIVNHTLVVIKVATVLLFLFATFGYINADNWKPFIPPAEPNGKYGFSGVLTAATQVFFAYIGFDAVSTCANETKNPSRDVPIGVLGSLAVCTVLYILVSMNITGIVNFRNIPASAPLSNVVAELGMKWLKVAISIGAVAGLSSVILISMLGQTRVFYSMAYDGLLPPIFARIHPKFKTPIFPTLLTGTIVALSSGFVPLDVLGDVTSAGTLAAFFMTSVATGVLRYTRPDLHRPFRIPGGYLVPLLGAATCLFLLVTSGWIIILRVIIWMAIGLLIYGLYGYKNSRVRTGAPPPAGAADPHALEDIKQPA